MYIHCICGSTLITLRIYGGNSVLCLREDESPAGWVRNICVEQVESMRLRATLYSEAEQHIIC